MTTQWTFMALLLCCLHACKPAPSEERFVEFENDSVRVIFPIDKADLEIGGLRDEYSAVFSPVPSVNRRSAVRFIEEALSKYPSGFLSRYVKRIYVFGSLTVGNLPVGGTYDRPSTIYVIFDPALDPFWLEHGLHAEVSSLLYHEASKIVVSVGLTYQLDYGLGDTLENFSLGYDKESLERGYLYPYATSSPEEDFNSLIATLLTGDQVVWQYATEYERFGRKLNKAKIFLSELDERFTEQYLWDIAFKQ